VKSTVETNSAIDGSNLCMECGLCCTYIFSHVTISKNAYNRLPEVNVKIVDDEIKMQFPCSYYQENICSVYEQRPNNCHTYHCILLIDTIKGNILLEEAQQIVRTTKEQITWLLRHIPNILNTSINEDEINLRDSLYTIYKLFSDKMNEGKDLSSSESQFCLHVFDYLKGMTKYFEDSSLLIKYNNLILNNR